MHNQLPCSYKFVEDTVSCGACLQREKCLRTHDKTPMRQVSFMHKEQNPKIKSIEIMKVAIDSEAVRKLDGKRMGTVEPMFGNLRSNKGLDRFVNLPQSVPGITRVLRLVKQPVFNRGHPVE